MGEIGITESEGLAQTFNVIKPAELGVIKKQETSPDSQTQRLIRELQMAGIEVERLPTENIRGINEIILLQDKEREKDPTEPKVRVFRGITSLTDISSLEQTPYAMRTSSINGQEITTTVTTNHEIEATVNQLANEPTYNNLADYINEIQPHLTPHDSDRFREELRFIEDGILEGRSIRSELMANQAEHSGGYADIGLSPYISASWNPELALDYSYNSSGAVLVIDIPLSRIVDNSLDSDELGVIGVIRPQDITAIVTLGKRGPNEPKPVQGVLDSVNIVNEYLDRKIIGPEETRTLRAIKLANDREKEKAQWKVDVQEIRERRSQNLLVSFPEIGLDYVTLQEQALNENIDIYTKTKTAIFDLLVHKFETIEYRGYLPLEEYTYEEPNHEIKKYNRNNVTDTMLTRLQELLKWKEQRKRKLESGQ